MRQVVCIDNYGMEEHLTVGKTYDTFGPSYSPKLIRIDRLDTGKPGDAFGSRFKPASDTRSVKVKKVKQKPLTRQKTDITVSYSNGKSYTLKNVSALYIQGDVFQVTVKQKGAPGVTVTKAFRLDKVTMATMRTPEEVVSIGVYKDQITVDTKHHSFSAEYYFWEE